MAMVTLGEASRLPGIGKTTLARAIELARVYPFPAPTVAADTTVTATGPTTPPAAPTITGATVALEAEIAGLREVGEFCGGSSTMCGRIGTGGGSGRAARPDEAAAIAVLVATAGRLAERSTAPTTLRATSNLYSPRRRYCAVHECRDRQRDRNILLSKPLPCGSLKVVVARAPRDLRSYQLGRALRQWSTEAACVAQPARLSGRSGPAHPPYREIPQTPRRWASMVTLDADRKLGAARIPPSASLSGP